MLPALLTAPAAGWADGLFVVQLSQVDMNMRLLLGPGSFFIDGLEPCPPHGTGAAQQRVGEKHGDNDVRPDTRAASVHVMPWCL